MPSPLFDSSGRAMVACNQIDGATSLDCDFNLLILCTILP
jgi:hypothetical protein